MRAVVFGRIVSVQVRSNKEVANFWLVVRVRWGSKRCIIVGKYPSRVENLVEFDE